MTVRYKAQVNKYNYNGHILYNTPTSVSRSISEGLDKTDSLLTGNHYDNNNQIYSQAGATQIFYLTHYGLEKDIFNKDITFDDESSITSKIQITPNVDLSLVNLS